MSVVLLADAKAYLNITVTTYDTELQGFIDAAEAAIAVRCGSLTSVPVTEQTNSACRVLMLSSLPVVSITSITSLAGAVASLSDLVVDKRAGVVTGLARDTYTVVYQAGRASVPEDLKMAVKELVRHLWTTQRGAGVRPGSAIIEPTSTGYLLPYRVQELMAPYVQPGFA
jgi:hypothetical protein